MPQQSLTLARLLVVTLNPKAKASILDGWTCLIGVGRGPSLVTACGDTSADPVWRALVRFVIVGICLMCLNATGSTQALSAPSPVTPKQAPSNAAAPSSIDSTSTIATAFLSSLTEEERSWLKAHPVIRVFSNPAWPPIEFIDEQGNSSGITKDYLTLIEQRLGQKFEYVAHKNWEEGYADLKRGEIDMAPSEAKTPQRLAFWAFTKPYMSVPIVIATHQGVSYIDNMHELEGKRVAVVEGFAVVEWMTRDFPQIRLIKVKTSLEGLQRLQRGEVDAFIDNLLIIGYHQSMHKALNLKISGITPYFNAQRMAVRNDWAPFAAILQKALDSISEAERYEIYRRWVPPRYELDFDYTLLWRALAVFALILLGVGLWNRSLAREVRERKQAQAALKASEQNLAITLHSIGDAVIATDAGGNITRMNPTAERLTGWALAESIGRPLSEVFHIINAETREAVTDPILRVITHAQLVGLANHTILRDKGGQECQITDSAAPIRGADGQVAGVVLVFSDVSEKYHAEKAVLHRKIMMERTENMARLASFEWDIDANITTWSPEMFRIFGRDPALDSPNLQGQAELYTPQSAQKLLDAVEKAVSDGTPYELELMTLQADGEQRPCLVKGFPERDDSGRVVRLIGLVQDITERKEYENQLKYLAHFDALTNLPNRVLSADRLQQAMAQEKRRGRQLAVVYLDLDGFKAINDRHGHATGDQVLITVAKRMMETLRKGDTLARLGGDEFMVVLVGLEDTSASAPLLNRLLAAVAEPVQVGVLSLHVSASLGVTFYPQAQDIEPDQLLRQADQAMYHAKVAGKNRYQIFDAAQDSHLRFQHESLARIRLALAQREFVLHYQPKVNMRNGKIIGAEALIRWQHPDKGLLAPAVFLPVIEDHSLAVDVGEWVIDTALTQIELWHAAGIDLPVSVNIGARQLQQNDFVARLQAILANHPHVDPTRLELEVLETSALADMAQVGQVIDDCAKIGVMFALDDFGTGYSSLTYLKRLRVARIKIDQSFVRDLLTDPNDAAIVDTIIALSRSLGLEVIAEGVETPAQRDLLARAGCRLYQGYLFSRPLPPDLLEAFLHPAMH